MIRDHKRQGPSADQLLRHAAWTRQLARSLVADDALADDVAQETWLSALRRPPETRESLKPWLRTVVRHQVFNRVRERQRREAREKQVDVADSTESSEELLDRLELHKVLVEAVGQLAEPYRQMVLLRYFEDLSSKEIGSRENLPPGTVRGRLKTAVALLREALDARYGGRALWMGPITALSHPPRTAQPGSGARPSTPPRVAPGLAGGAHWVLAGSVAVALVATTWWVVRHPTRTAAGFVTGDRGASQMADEEPGEARGRPTPNREVASERVAPRPSDALAAGPTSREVGSGRSSSIARGVPERHAIAGVVIAAGSVAAKARSENRIGRDDTLADVSIRIVKGAPRSATQPTGQLLLAIRDRRYRPRIQVGQIGQSIIVANGEEAARSVRAFQGSTKLFDAIIPGGARSPAIAIPETLEPIRFDSSESPAEVAFVVPTDNVFHAVTGDDGRFVLNDLPPGTYSIEAWDENLGTLTEEVTVPLLTGHLMLFSFGRGSSLAATSRRDGPCKIAVEGRGPVGQECQRGGVKAATKFMKDIVKQAKVQGEKVTCDSCHQDLDSHNLLEGAKDRLDRVLARLGKEQLPRTK